MKNKRWLGIAVTSALLMAGCSGNGDSSEQNSNGSTPDTQSAPAVISDSEDITLIDGASLFSERDLEHSYLESKCDIITLDGNTAQCSSTDVSISGGNVTISAEGNYLIRGTLTEGSITINCDKKEKVRLILDNAHISSSSNAAIYVAQADKVFLTLADGSENSLESSGFSSAAEANVDGALFSKDDLTINGSGKLRVVSSANAIVSKNDLTVTGGIFDLDAGNHALAGKDSISIYTAEMTINSAKDGIHAENKDDTALGSLYIRDGKYLINSDGDGISAAASLQIDGGSFDIVTGGGSEGSVQSSCKAIKAAGAMALNNGTFTLNSADDAIHSDSDATITGGSFEIKTGDDAFHSGALLTVTAGLISVPDSYEGLEALSIDISGGDITLVTSDDGLNAAGGNDDSGFGGRGGDIFATNSDCYVNISGGTLKVNAGGDGIDSNGSINVSGGQTYISGSVNGGNSALDYGIDATVTGGSFLAAGSQQMAMNFSKAENQGAALLNVGNQPAGTLVKLCDNSGKELLTWTADKEFSSLAITCPEMKQGESYTLYCGDSANEFALESLLYGSPNGFGGFGGMGDFGGGFGGGGMGGFGNMNRPDDFGDFTPPEGFDNITPPEDFDGMTRPDGFEGMAPPEGFDGMTPPNGFNAMTPSELNATI